MRYNVTILIAGRGTHLNDCEGAAVDGIVHQIPCAAQRVLESASDRIESFGTLQILFCARVASEPQVVRGELLQCVGVWDS